MQLFTIVSALLLTTLAVARDSQITFQDDNLKVPGNNPLEYCQDPSDYQLDLDSVDLDPNPPEAGKSLAIAANGTLSKAVEEGAKVHVQVKYGVIRLLNQEMELCDYVDQVDESCPIDKGNKKLVKSIDLPDQIPAGKYSVLAEVTNKDGSEITCLKATVEFKRDGGSSWWRRA